MSSTRLTDPQAPDDLLLYRLGRLAATAGIMVVRLCEGRYGITRREWRALAWLGRQDGVLSSQLADRIQLDRARTSRAVTSMVAKGLLRRVPGQADRREVCLTLTLAGRALYEELMPQVQAINRDLLAPLRAAQAQALDDTLKRLQARAERLAAQSDYPKADRRRGGRAATSAGLAR
jgi:DNA-binding MarR family transcriptional regulator